MATTQTAYGFGVRIAAPHQTAIERTGAALKEQGFGIISTIDMQRALKEKLGVTFRPYVILGACNPPLAHRALQADLGIGLLLPCNVVVYDNGDGTSTVEAMDPEAALGIAGDNPLVAEVASDAKGRLQKALGALGEGR